MCSTECRSCYYCFYWCCYLNLGHWHLRADAMEAMPFHFSYHRGCRKGECRCVSAGWLQGGHQAPTIYLGQLAKLGLSEKNGH